MTVIVDLLDTLSPAINLFYSRRRRSYGSATAVSGSLRD